MSATHDERRRKPLQKVRSVCIEVVNSNLNKRQHLISNDDLQPLIELMMRVAGIRVVSQREEDAGTVQVCCQAKVVKIDEFECNLICGVAVLDAVTITRNGVVSESIVWQQAESGQCFRGLVANTCREYFSRVLTVLANDLLTVSPECAGRVADDRLPEDPMNPRFTT
jgi:hypothetical protein